MIPVSAAIDSWTLRQLWEWFAVHPFRLPALTIASAIGIMLVIQYIIRRNQKHDGKLPTAKDVFTVVLLTPLFFLASGWIVHHWI
jgi:uncharacterized membrane protein SpoIIM required for sporulation